MTFSLTVHNSEPNNPAHSSNIELIEEKSVIVAHRTLRK